MGKKLGSVFGNALCLFAMLLVEGGCSIEDNRDRCPLSAIIRFRCIELGEDCFSSNIHSIRHFLFTDNGTFIREVESNPNDMKTLLIYDIPAGDYNMVTIANATEDRFKIDGLSPNESSLRDLKASVVSGLTRADMNNDNRPDLQNADELFWNEGSFSIPQDTVGVIYTGDLSNIHCHLRVRVFWHTMPKYDGMYTMRLRNVPTAYTLDPAREYMTLVQKNGAVNDYYEKDIRLTFPGYEDEVGNHSLGAYLFNLELQGEFVTLRYTYDMIPVFQLLHNGEPVTKEIDLKRAFRAWHWNPDANIKQEYRIQMEIYDDGHVVVSQWLEGNVADWQDGGRISNN